MPEIIESNNDFTTILNIIEASRRRAMKAVNAELITMYWEVGKYLSSLVAESSFGDKVIDEVAAYIAKSNPTIKGFNRRGLYRMKQFYETYRDDDIVTPLVTQISWTNHLLIMSGSKTAEERRFYIELCIRETTRCSQTASAVWFFVWLRTRSALERILCDSDKCGVFIWLFKPKVIERNHPSYLGRKNILKSIYSV